MSVDVRQQIADIIDRYEGGAQERLRPGSSFSDDADDHGGATRWGISRPLLSEYLHLGPTELCPVGRVKNLTLDEAVTVGAEMIALRPGLYRIADDRLRYVTLDFAFHSGPATATKTLQAVVGQPPDGLFGPHTETAVNAVLDTNLACERVTAGRLAFLGADVAKHPDQARWIHGWLLRVGQVLCYRGTWT